MAALGILALDPNNFSKKEKKPAWAGVEYEKKAINIAETASFNMWFRQGLCGISPELCVLVEISLI